MEALSSPSLDGYPFGKLIERYEWVTHNKSN
jgi:hypothetical protein